MKKIILIIIICSQLFLLSGCWGAKEIQSQIYISGIGLDYDEGEFTVYIKSINFANIAKQEGASGLAQISPVFVGEIKGKTIQEALNKLEQNSALPLYYGHVETIILSENVIKEQMKSVIEFIGQDPLMRYNVWLFGTNQDIKKILTSESFLNLPSIYTIIHKPDTKTKRNYFMPIEKYNKFISTYYQPVGTQIIPSIEMNQSDFSEEDKQKNIATVTGGFVVSQQEYKGRVDKEDLEGLKWLSKNATNIPISLFEDKVSVIISKPKSTINVVDGEIPAYHLMVIANAVLLQNEENLSIDEIKKELEKKIKMELLKTMEKSEEINADLLNISEKTYRFHNNKWEVRAINSIDKESIKSLEVEIKLEQNINYKR